MGGGRKNEHGELKRRIYNDGKIKNSDLKKARGVEIGKRVGAGVVLE